MTAATLLQIFVYLNVLIIGAVAVIAAQHAYAHFRPDKHEPEKHHTPPPNDHVPAAVKEHMLQASQAKFETMLNQSVDALQHDLNNTTEQINNLIKRLATEVVGSELEHYRNDLAKLHEQAQKDLGGIKTELDGHQAELRAQAAQELEAEKQQLIKQIDTKLGDAVGSFLLEALQHNVDLGSQTTYLLALLEEHKADFTQEVVDETQPAG
jgi:DNA anti-recombination protein RmuC